MNSFAPSLFGFAILYLIFIQWIKPVSISAEHCGWNYVRSQSSNLYFQIIIPEFSIFSYWPNPNCCYRKCLYLKNDNQPTRPINWGSSDESNEFPWNLRIFEFFIWILETALNRIQPVGSRQLKIQVNQIYKKKPIALQFINFNFVSFMVFM